MATKKTTEAKKSTTKRARPSASVIKKNTRCPLTFDLKKVEQYAGLGMSQENIARALGCSERTIRNRLKDDAAFAEAYARGLAKREVKVASMLAQRCNDGDVSAIKFWLQSCAGWSERQKIELQAEITADTTLRLEDMSTEQLEAALKKLEG